MVELFRSANGIYRQALNALYVRNVWCERWQVETGSSALSVNINTHRARKAPLLGARRELPDPAGQDRVDNTISRVEVDDISHVNGSDIEDRRSYRPF